MEHSDNALVQLAAQADDPFHINEALNGIPLPAWRNASHPAYNTMLNSKMNGIMTDLKNQYGDNIPTDVAKMRLMELIECVTNTITSFPSLNMQNLAPHISNAC